MVQFLPGLFAQCAFVLSQRLFALALNIKDEQHSQKPPARSSLREILAFPEVGGLHHRYERRAA